VQHLTNFCWASRGSSAMAELLFELFRKGYHFFETRCIYCPHIFKANQALVIPGVFNSNENVLVLVVVLELKVLVLVLELNVRAFVPLKLMFVFLLVPDDISTYYSTVVYFSCCCDGKLHCLCDRWCCCHGRVCCYWYVSVTRLH